MLPKNNDEITFVSPKKSFLKVDVQRDKNNERTSYSPSRFALKKAPSQTKNNMNIQLGDGGSSEPESKAQSPINNDSELKNYVNRICSISPQLEQAKLTRYRDLESVMREAKSQMKDNERVASKIEMELDKARSTKLILDINQSPK